MTINKASKAIAVILVFLATAVHFYKVEVSSMDDIITQTLIIMLMLQNQPCQK